MGCWKFLLVCWKLLLGLKNTLLLFLLKTGCALKTVLRDLSFLDGPRTGLTGGEGTLTDAGFGLLMIPAAGMLTGADTRTGGILAGAGAGTSRS